MSEGLRKIGSLIHLILNGSLIKNGFLIWDEPETSLNPKLVTVVALMLRHLAGFGIQIFVATHDFLLLNELALTDDFRNPPGDTEPIVDVQFFGLDLAPDQSHVIVDSASRLRDLHNNDILDEFAAYYDRRNSLAQRQRRSV